jgi:UDP-N-acetylglucosamine acyltransferase
MNIHPSAIIAETAVIHPSAKIGPFAVIGAHVKIGENTVVGAHCFIDGNTEIGPNNILFPSVAIGCPPQDLKFSAEQKTFVKIGEGNHFREFVTVHLAEGEGCCTTIGNHNLLMANVHIAHNCQVGSNVIMSNFATLAGHVHIGDRAVMGGFAGVHQFCKVGTMVMIGAKSKIVKDVPPYVLIDGNPARLIGLNSIGLRRNGVPREAIANIRQAYKLLFRSGLNQTQGKEKLMALPIAQDPYVREFLNFAAKSKRGVYARGRDSAAFEG